MRASRRREEGGGERERDGERESETERHRPKYRREGTEASSPRAKKTTHQIHCNRREVSGTQPARLDNSTREAYEDFGDRRDGRDRRVGRAGTAARWSRRACTDETCRARPYVVAR